MPSTTRARSPSPSLVSKKQRLDDKPGSLTAGPAISLPADTDVSNLAQQYQTSAPYKHISVPNLFEDGVLQGVVSESRTYGTRHEEGSLPGWGWEHKETDIYKVSSGAPTWRYSLSGLHSQDSTNSRLDVAGSATPSGRNPRKTPVSLQAQREHLQRVSVQVAKARVQVPSS